MFEQAAATLNAWPNVTITSQQTVTQAVTRSRRTSPVSNMHNTTNMKHIHTKKISLALALGLPGLAIAGTEMAPVPPAEESNNGSFCEWLQNKPGTIWKDKSNPYLQEIQIDGRMQFQMGYMDGSDVNGTDFDETYNEFRRFRLGVKTKFLQYFYAKAVWDLVDDQRPQNGAGSVNWGYSQFDEAYLGFDLGKAINSSFDTLELRFGRQKYVLGHEARESSKEILTVERSAISNKVYGSYRPTGLTLEAETGPWSFMTSLYSSTTDGRDDNDEFNWYQDALIYYVGAGYQVNDELSFYADYAYNGADVTEGDDNLIAYAWATSIAADYNTDMWGVTAEFIYGDNGGSRIGNGAGREDTFYGFVLTPHVWIMKDQLQWVGQYQYQGSEDPEGVRVNSRYGRARGTGVNGIDVNSGRGDAHHSFYTGLNYYVCGHAAKIMGGIEYQTMDTPAGEFDTLTYLLAFRTYF